ncbi:MAG: HD domain-containing phosphohydrolase [Bdellovibrionota bacterium]
MSESATEEVNNKTRADLILIISSEPAFEEFATEILAEFSSFFYLRVEDTKGCIDAVGSGAAPFMAIIDGTLGTQFCSAWLQTLKSVYKIPVLVLHDSTTALETPLLRQQGADCVVHRHYDREFIVDLILDMLTPDPENNMPLAILRPISPRELDANKELTFNVYMHLPGNQRTIHLRHKGTFIEQTTIDRFEASKRHLYIKKTESKEFFRYVNDVTHSPQDMMRTERLLTAKKYIFEIMSEFFAAEVNNLEAGRTILERCKGIIREYDLLKTYTPEEAFNYIISLTNNIRTYYHDAINVAAISALLGHILGMKPEQIESLAMAGLLHNVGLAYSPEHYPGMDAKLLSKDGLISYHKYPELSIHLVKGKRVPLVQEVSDAILQHQENCDGSGFPKALRSEKIKELGKIVRLALRIQELTALVEGTPKIEGVKVFDYLRDEVLAGKSYHDISLITNIHKRISVAKKSAA